MPILFKTLRNGDDFSCTADGGPAFLVGRRVSYEGHIGLYNVFARSRLKKLNYLASDFQGQHGFWASLIESTAICEGLNFLTLNTYDTAAFTFGFGQFAAHVPDRDFVKYFTRDFGKALEPGRERFCRSQPALSHGRQRTDVRVHLSME